LKGLLAALVLIKEIWFLLKKSYKNVRVFKIKKDLIEAKDEAFEEKDTKIIEESLGSGAGNPSRHGYTGMYVRKKKPRSEPDGRS